MGHLNENDTYRRLGQKLDDLPMGAPWNKFLYAILKEAYSEEEADVVVKMPYGLSNLDRISKITGYEENKLRKILDSLSARVYVLDLWINGEYYYMLLPLVAGFLEVILMRTGILMERGKDLDIKKLSNLIHEYMWHDHGFLEENFRNSKFSYMRVVPHEGSIGPLDYTEVLDYEKATALVEQFNKFAIGPCACRLEAFHRDKKTCNTPMDACSSFGITADVWIRHNIAREVSKTEMLEHIARSREMGLVLNADNVKRKMTFMCHCCGCCCNMLLGVKKLGYPHIVVTSNYISAVNGNICTGCGKCAKACPINAIEMILDTHTGVARKKTSKINESLCIGCGVCALKCSSGSIQLVKRKKRVIHPETTFERIILQSLDRGTLQNQLFDNPASITQKYMRGFIGGFLRLPSVKKALMSDMLRSSFLKVLTAGVKLQGKGWLTEL